MIVSCTDRKSLHATPNLRLRSIQPDISIDSAVEEWARRITAASGSADTLKLRDLYQGEYWSVAKELEHECQMYVMSAGLGMRTMDSCGPGYAATFSRDSADSVLRFSTSRPEAARMNWWEGLTREGLGIGKLTTKCTGVVLVAVSDSYQQALSDHLVELSTKKTLIYTISGSPQVHSLKGVKNIFHIQVGQWVRMVLGGSTPSIGIRFAARMIRNNSYSSPKRAQEFLKMLYDEYSHENSTKLPVFERRQLSDSQVKDWIKLQFQNSPGRNSKSTFLRVFRESGYACEQKRFGRLFDEVIG